MNEVKNPAAFYTLLTLNEVLEITSMKRSNVYRLIRLGEFPRPVHLSERHARWIKQEIIQFIEKKMSERR